MSINSPDLHILVSRTTDAERIGTQQERAGQHGAMVAGLDQKLETERAEHRVAQSPKAHGGKVGKDGHNKSGHRGDGGSKQGEAGQEAEPKTRPVRGQGGHRLDIKI